MCDDADVSEILADRPRRERIVGRKATRAPMAPLSSTSSVEMDRSAHLADGHVLAEVVVMTHVGRCMVRMRPPRLGARSVSLRIRTIGCARKTFVAIAGIDAVRVRHARVAHMTCRHAARITSGAAHAAHAAAVAAATSATARRLRDRRHQDEQTRSSQCDQTNTFHFCLFLNVVWAIALYEPHVPYNGVVVIKGNRCDGSLAARRWATTRAAHACCAAGIECMRAQVGPLSAKRKHALPIGYKRAAFSRRERRRESADQFGAEPAIAAFMSP